MFTLVSWVLGLVLLKGHLAAYGIFYKDIFFTFAITLIMKKLISTMSKEHASIFGLGGYALTIASFCKLLVAIHQNGTGMNLDDINMKDLIDTPIEMPKIDLPR